MTRMTGCSIAAACRAMDKPRSWYYYQGRNVRRPVRRPEVEPAIRQLLGGTSASYG